MGTLVGEMGLVGDNEACAGLDVGTDGGGRDGLVGIDGGGRDGLVGIDGGGRDGLTYRGDGVSEEGSDGET